jgi:NAD(P)-dependent dehydrogenase (short-subunit alcohol dehydrogenase family)
MTLNDNLYVLRADLASMKDIKTACSEIERRHKKIDLIINNAGLMSADRKLSKDNIELNFAVNHLAPFLITNLLLDKLKNSESARIINVSSGAHFMAKMDFDNLMFEKDYKRIKAYAQSKLANILFTFYLAKKLSDTKITVNCMNPGPVATNLGRDFSKFSQIIWKIIAKSPKRGADTIIYLSESDYIASVTGKYFEKRKIKKPSETSNDPKIQKKLWDVSKKLCKEYL